VEGRHVEVVRLLLEAGADVRRTTPRDRMNLLHILAEQGTCHFLDDGKVLAELIFWTPRR
jgi:hypothetical protein